MLEKSLEKLSAQWNDSSAQYLKYLTNAEKGISSGHLLSALVRRPNSYFKHLNKPLPEPMVTQIFGTIWYH